MGLEESLRQAVHQRQEGQQIVHAVGALTGDRFLRQAAERLRRQLLAAAAQHADDRIDLAALALGGHHREHFPHVAERFVIVAALAALVHAADEAPLNQLAQVHADVAARNGQPGHDVVHRQSRPGDVKQTVDLRHRRIDAPQRAHGAPQIDELIFDFLQTLTQGGLGHFHEFYSFQEDMKL